MSDGIPFRVGGIVLCGGESRRMGTCKACLAWGNGHLLATVVAIALVGVVTCGALLGSLLPLAFKRVGVDPAVASTPFVASLVDVVGIVLYFQIAQLLLIG